MTSSKGSDWHKWDLHIHTPYSNLNSYTASDDDFINEIVSKEVAVIGLTNYFCFKDEEYELLQKLTKANIKTFLNLELRLDYQNKDDDCLDFHIIFSDELELNKIKNFLKNLDVNACGDAKKCSDLKTKAEFETAVVNFDNLMKELTNPANKLSSKFLTGFLSRGKGNGRSSSIYEKISKSVDFLIHSTDHPKNIEEDRNYWLTQGKPLLQSSDAHSLEKIGSKFTWIKADLSFSGLQQIGYEPEFRLVIDKNRPKHATSVINSIKLNFQKNETINGNNFCFAGLENEIQLSPCLNCFIGGRGTGKSSILNLIGVQNNSPDSVEFWNRRKTSFDPTSCFIVNGTTNFEFIGQSQIEKLVADTDNFTQALFERIDQKDDGKLTELKTEIENSMKIANDTLGKIDELQKIGKKVEAIKIEKTNLTKLIESLDTKEFQEIKNNIERHTNELNALEKAEELEVNLNILKVEDNSQESLSKINIDSETYELLKGFYTGYESIIQARDELKNNYRIQERISVVRSNIEKENKKLEDYLTNNGYTIEDAKDLSSAPAKIAQYNSKLSIEEQDINTIKESISQYFKGEFLQIDTLYTKFSTALDIAIKPLAKILNQEQASSSEIETITIKYSFDDDKSWNDFANNVAELVKEANAPKKINTKKIAEIICDNRAIFSEDHVGGINNLIDKEQDKKGTDAEFLKALKSFFDNRNFEKFKILREMNCKDWTKYLRIDLKYGENKIEETSYGQRCTAVIVAFLLFGNKPLIIDEPETHLDSSLIAEYLVGLIKRNKNKRQIIFATHNANFVINGDAEKVVILETEKGVTNFTETTLEGTSSEKLLKLEGGKEAFHRRRNKYKLD